MSTGNSAATLDEIMSRCGGCITGTEHNEAIADLVAALKSAETAVEQLCWGQDHANQCWFTLAEIRAAIAKAEGRQ